MCYVRLETTMLCMWTTMCLELINGCVEPIIYDTSCIYDQCMSFFSLVPKYLCYLTDEFFCLVIIVVVVISNMSC
jgi:hypothetical protein